jgi:hypothetical protein
MFNDGLGWMIDDLDLMSCPVWVGGGEGVGVAAEARATSYPETYCEGSGGRVDALGSYCAACPTLDYQWSENGVPIPGANGVVYAIPATRTPAAYDYTVEIGCATSPDCTDVSDATSVRIVAAPLTVGATLTVAKLGGGADLEFHWDDVNGADDYALLSDTDPASDFATEEGSGSSGSTGIVVPVPGERLVHYVVAGRNPTCGMGPKR